MILFVSILIDQDTCYFAVNADEREFFSKHEFARRLPGQKRNGRSTEGQWNK